MVTLPCGGSHWSARRESESDISKLREAMAKRMTMSEMLSALATGTLSTVTTFQARILIVGLYLDIWALSNIVTISRSHAADISTGVMFDLLQTWKGLVESSDGPLSVAFSISSENPVEHDPLILNAITCYRVCQVQLRTDLQPIIEFLRDFDHHKTDVSEFISSLRNMITRSPNTTKAMRFCYEALRTLLGQGSKFLENVPVFMTWGVEQAPQSACFSILLSSWLSKLPRLSPPQGLDAEESELVMDIYQLLRDSGVKTDVNTDLASLIAGSWSQVMSKPSPWKITDKLSDSIACCQHEFSALSV